MRRNGLISLIFILVVAFGGLGGTFAAGNEPLLGLDLQGGVSVVLEPVGESNDDAVDQAVRIIRQRVDGLGVAEPEISRQGGAIVVQLPGVDDRDRAIDLVGQTAELRFRPVLNVQQTGIDLDALETDVSSTTTVAEDEGTEDDGTEDDGTDDDGADSGEGGDEPTSTTEAADEEEGVSGIRSFPAQDDTTTTTADESTTTTVGDDTTTTTAPEGEDPFEGMSDEEILEELFGPLTSAEDDVPSAQVTLPQYDSDDNEIARFTLGAVPGAEEPDDPATLPLTGEILSTARASLGTAGTWTVDIEAKGGADGIDRFNQAAAQCFSGLPECPSGRLAIVLDGRVISAPQIQAASFEADQIQISGNFTERDAKDLALALRYGALPVELEQQQVQSVSASLGQDALDAGVVAGIIGLGLVFVYMLVYYRLLGLVAMASLSLSGALLWTVISYLGESQGLALTLAGVTGIIVSIGVAVDSNVVFYEHLKEGVSRGRSLRTAVDGSFRTAFSTIVKADVASLIGAGVLYWLTVGPVRGFALYLGLSTVLDLVASYFFMRPATLMLAKSRRLQDRPRMFGMPSADSSTGVVAEGARA